MTQDELEMLPIYSPFDYIEIPLPDARYPNAIGNVFRKPIAKKGYATSYENNDIVCFTDKNSDTWEFVKTDEGWHKVKFF